MPKEEQNRLVIKARPYTLCDGHLHKLRPNGMLKQCLTPIETSKFLEKFHEGLTVGHYGNNTIVKKIMSIGYCGQLFTKMLLTYVKGVTSIND